MTKQPRIPDTTNMSRIEAIAWQREAVDRLAVVYTEMDGYVQLFRQMPNKLAYVVVSKRWNRSGAECRSVRWRDLNDQHIVFEVIEAKFKEQPPSVAAWYRNIDQQMSLLNLQERVCRYWITFSSEAIDIIDAGKAKGKDNQP
jgi:hypothetical protein